MPTRNSGASGSLRSEITGGVAPSANPRAKYAVDIDGLSSEKVARQGLLSKKEYDAISSDYKTTFPDGTKMIMVNGGAKGSVFVPWTERDERIPAGKSAWDIGRDEARGYGMDDQALADAQRLEAGGRGAGHATINAGGGGFKVNYPDPYRQAYDSYLVDSSRNPKSVIALANEALSQLSGKDVRRLGSTKIEATVDEYVSARIGKSVKNFKGVKWNMKSYPD